MTKAFGIAALLAGALSILPSTAHADPTALRRERVARQERFERERFREHERFERARHEEGLRRAWWHHHHGWRY